MKRHLPLAALLVLAFATFCFAQPQATASPSPSSAAKPKPKMSKAQLLKKLSANETALWTAWQNKDIKPFQMWLTADGVSISEQGLGTKADLIKQLPSMGCVVKSFTLSDWKLSMVDANAALLTYKGVTDGHCVGQALPPVWSSSLWINRKGKWVMFSHTETNVKTQ